MPLQDQGVQLTASVSLNSYSWTVPNEENAESLKFVPYGIQTIYPNGGPLTGGSQVIINGKGFVESEVEKPRCRFGSGTIYAIVEAEILSYERMTCRAPGGLEFPSQFELPIDVQFQVALLSDTFDPWTEGSTKFRFYNQPQIGSIEPAQVNVGQIKEVNVFIDEESGTHFFKPVPVNAVNIVGDDDKPVMGGFSGIKCKFGRFGQTIAAYYNSTMVKCSTPAVPEDPDDIYEETVTFAIAMNGFDFEEDISETDFTFIGTGSYWGLTGMVIAIILTGLVIGALVVYCHNGSLDTSANVNKKR